MPQIVCQHWHSTLMSFWTCSIKVAAKFHYEIRTNLFYVDMGLNFEPVLFFSCFWCLRRISLFLFIGCWYEINELSNFWSFLVLLVVCFVAAFLFSLFFFNSDSGYLFIGILFTILWFVIVTSYAPIQLAFFDWPPNSRKIKILKKFDIDLLSPKPIFFKI